MYQRLTNIYEAATILGVKPDTVRRESRNRGFEKRGGLWLFTPEEIEQLKVRKPLGRPRKTIKK